MWSEPGSRIEPEEDGGMRETCQPQTRTRALSRKRARVSSRVGGRAHTREPEARHTALLRHAWLSIARQLQLHFNAASASFQRSFSFISTQRACAFAVYASNAFGFAEYASMRQHAPAPHGTCAYAKQPGCACSQPAPRDPHGRRHSLKESLNFLLRTPGAKSTPLPCTPRTGSTGVSRKHRRLRVERTPG
eukprot:2925389-Rhodomonas_salina.3